MKLSDRPAGMVDFNRNRMRRRCFSQVWVKWALKLSLAVTATISGSLCLQAMETAVEPLPVQTSLGSTRETDSETDPDGSLSLSEPDLEDLDSLLSVWETSFTARVAGGYKDNVALAHLLPESSSFVKSGLEALLLRLPVDGNQLTFLFSGEDIRYFSSDLVDHEDVLIAQGEFKHYWLNDWQASFGVDGIYLDQVFDLSVSDTNRQAVVVRGGAVTVRPGVRRELPEKLWVSLELPATQQFFNEPALEYWELGPKFVLGWTYGNRSELRTGYAFLFRDYDSEPARDSNGTVIPATVRESTQHDVEIAWDHRWDVRRRWRSTTKAGYRRLLDAQDGYFDFDRYQLAHRLRYQTDVWDLSAEARIAYYEFAVQTVSPTDSDHRNRADVEFSVHVERAISKKFRLFADYTHGRVFSNVSFDEYRVNTASAGVSFEL